MSSTDDSSTLSFGSRATTTAALTLYGSTSSICRQPLEPVLAVAAPVKKFDGDRLPPRPIGCRYLPMPLWRWVVDDEVHPEPASPMMDHLPKHNTINISNGCDHEEGNKQMTDRHEPMLAATTVSYRRREWK